MEIIDALRIWSMSDTFAISGNSITTLLSSYAFMTDRQPSNNLSVWNALVGAVPDQMTIEELLQFLTADSESDQQAILNMIAQRVGVTQTPAQAPVQVQKR